MVSIFHNDVHLMLEHVRCNFHKLESPSGLLTTTNAWLGVVNLMADFNVNEWRHFVKKSPDFVVKLS